jgi:hypothetical protein
LQVLATQPRRPQRYGIFNDMFADNVVELKPFSLQSDTITITAEAAAVKGKNWLPLRSMEITEKFDGVQNAKVGETITRKVKIIAKGAFAKQLPSVKEFMDQDQIKTYANKPIFTDNFNESLGTVVGTREEEYSIVPQQEGTITLPAIKVSWFNLQTKKNEISTLPEKTIKVAPATSTNTPNITIDYSNQTAPQEIQGIETSNSDKSGTWYLLLGLAGGILTAVVIVTVYLVGRRIIRARNIKIKIKTNRHKAQMIEITNILSLRDFILHYAIRYWQAPKDVTLNRIGDNLTNNGYNYDITMYLQLCNNINAELYGSSSQEFAILLQDWEDFKKTVSKQKQYSKKDATNEDYSSLNPT